MGPIDVSNGRNNFVVGEMVDICICHSDIAVPQSPLDNPQIHPQVSQPGREGVSGLMWVHPLTDSSPFARSREHSAHVRCVNPGSFFRAEEVLRIRPPC